MSQSSLVGLINRCADQMLFGKKDQFIRNCHDAVDLHAKNKKNRKCRDLAEMQIEQLAQTYLDEAKRYMELRDRVLKRVSKYGLGAP